MTENTVSLVHVICTEKPNVGGGGDIIGDQFQATFNGGDMAFDRRQQEVQRESVFNRLGNRFQIRSDSVASGDESFKVFVTGFPSHLTTRELWQICERHGKVVDVFIAPKLSKFGKPFGFVRFTTVRNEEEIIQKLCNTFIGKLKMHANKARFNRGDKINKGANVGDNGKSATHVSNYIPPNWVHAWNKSDHVQNSYTSVLKSGNSNRDNGSGTIRFKPVLLDDSCVNARPFKFAVAGCLKEFRSLPNLRALCDGEGFNVVTLRYLGGFWVLFQFVSEEASEAFLKHTGVNSWFDKLHMWSGEFDDSIRVVWLDIEGLPPYVWTDETFSRIAKRWEALVYVDDSKGNNLYSFRLCVQTKLKSIILESFEVAWRDNVATVTT